MLHQVFFNPKQALKLNKLAGVKDSHYSCYSLIIIVLEALKPNRLPCQLPCFFMRLGMGSSVQLIDTLTFSQNLSCQLVQKLPRQEFVPTRSLMRPGG